MIGSGFQDLFFSALCAHCCTVLGQLSSSIYIFFLSRCRQRRLRTSKEDSRRHDGCDHHHQRRLPRGFRPDAPRHGEQSAGTKPTRRRCPRTPPTLFFFIFCEPLIYFIHSPQIRPSVGATLFRSHPFNRHRGISRYADTSLTFPNITLSLPGSPRRRPPCRR